MQRCAMKAKGFSLIELMVVLAIVAILAAVAYPSYENSVRKTRRADAKESLTRAASMQERHFFTHNQYTASSNDVGGNSSTEGYYTVTILGNSVNCTTGGVSYPCFTMVATAAGAQAADKTCGQFSIDHTGRRRSFDTSTGSPVENTTTGECW